MGHNWPPEYPLFAGPRIRYHFLFFALTGWLEKAGIRMDIALDILSALGMAGLMLAVYALAVKISRSKAAGWLAMIFVVFNSSFSWLYYFKSHPISLKMFGDMASNATYYAFGPYDDRVVSAFWSPNIYTNQRHFAFSLALMFLALAWIYYGKRALSFVGAVLIIGAMSWLNKAVLLMLLVTVGCMFLAGRQKRERVFHAAFWGGLLALPGLLYLQSGPGGFSFHPGFLYASTSWKEFSSVPANPYWRWFVYWIMNLGFLPFAALAGWLMAGKRESRGSSAPALAVEQSVEETSTGVRWSAKLRTIFVWTVKPVQRAFDFIFHPARVWGVAGVAVFAVANIFIFSPDPAANHKLINFYIYTAAVYAGIFLVYLFKKNIAGKIASALLALVMILGGVVDIFPIINDSTYHWTDIPADPAAQWIAANTEPQDRFFNMTYDVNAATTAGRRVYWGWDYFAWSNGYDMNSRANEMRPIIQGIMSKYEACRYFAQHGLRYVLAGPTDTFLDVPVNKKYFDANFEKSAQPGSGLTIYDVQASCGVNIN
jgi:hypothetical protein